MLTMTQAYNVCYWRLVDRYCAAHGVDWTECHLGGGSWQAVAIQSYAWSMALRLVSWSNY